MYVVQSKKYVNKFPVGWHKILRIKWRWGQAKNQKPQAEIEISFSAVKTSYVPTSIGIFF
jgi:hypothetical protein